MFQIKVVEEIKTHILCLVTIFQKSCHLLDNVEKYGRVRQATDDNITQNMHFACWIDKATDTQLLLFHCYIGSTNAPQCYVIRTLPVLFRYLCDCTQHKQHCL